LIKKRICNLFTETMNKKEAFAYFGIKQTNERWSWSGISANKDLVVLTIWSDQKKFNKQTKTFQTSTFNQNNEMWINDLGNKERMELIQYCIDNLDSKFRAIFATPTNPGVIDETRDWKKGMPYDKQWFKLTKFNSQTGEFESESFHDNDSNIPKIEVL